MKGREESDGLMVPEDRRKAVPTYGGDRRGGKGVTASEEVRQLELFPEPVDSPQGADGGVGTGRPVSAPYAVPLSGDRKSRTSRAMEIEEVAREGNLIKAFEKVASNKGAPGPDGKSIEWVR
ncbi:MAG: hypothetical protein GY856_33115, partial [bacterium]|nr:hypothetical protein [bacterium]